MTRKRTDCGPTHECWADYFLRIPRVWQVFRGNSRANAQGFEQNPRIFAR